MTADELSECHKRKSFFTFQWKLLVTLLFFQQIAGTIDGFFWTGQLELFQRLTIFLLDSSCHLNGRQFFLERLARSVQMNAHFFEWIA